ncbi:phosphate ABC transporter permease PstA [Clostridium culturomicium]|uniref:phosphate ABC transporter permease PstA n=1 Tax=Clostridium culturomicium TaxID=1499683 RepID=UPI00058E5733|nr:phosphate ABC transporter permease PstA [Clostridium culturomicium]
MRKLKDNILKSILWLSAAITIAILLIIIGYIFKEGMGLINFNFIFGDYSPTEGGGIFPMIVTTLLTVLVSLVISIPIGIGGAIYLQEYAKQGAIVKVIRFATESLAGIPSIIYGLFGTVFFVTALKLQFSILAGSLTLAIIVLPVIIRTTEEALKTVPISYREGAIGLGSTKFEVLYKIIVPSAMPGIISGVILSIGRIIGESAAMLLTAGTVASMPKGLMSSGRTLTVHAYLVTKEAGDIRLACAIGIILIFVILILSIAAKLITRKINKAN